MRLIVGDRTQSRKPLLLIARLPVEARSYAKPETTFADRLFRFLKRDLTQNRKPLLLIALGC
ncbi:hypothetical protein CK220_08290 [Mesorhizobium sp. WSM3860]|nr:hypothetical protein CK220_08290 [Mesorhizobium sp. WSM3860]